MKCQKIILKLIWKVNYW